MIKVGTLFSGIGAPEQALQALGIPHSISFACDSDPYVKETYKLNYNCDVYYDDITSIKDLPKVNLLVFGFPCQPFSIAGNGNGLNDVRGKLLLTALSLIEKTPPDTVIAENVEGLLRCDDGNLLNYIIERFTKIGYNVHYSLLNSLDFGIPQRRNRLWIVATKKSGFEFPKPITNRPDLKSFLEVNVSERVFVTKKFLKKAKVRTKIRSYHHDYIPCITHTISRNGSSGEYISYVAAVNKAIGQLRKPTVNECRRLFGFSNGFRFPDSVCATRRYNMFGNSMVVPVVQSVIERLFL